MASSPTRERLVLLAFLPLALWREPELTQGAFRFELLDVGQGQAAILQTAKHTLVYDAGPAYPDGFDAGSDVVAQRLWKLGVARVDRLMISHGDNDHAGGLSSLARLFEPSSIVAGKGVSDIVFSQCSAGMTWVWDGVKFTTLHPQRAYASKNDASCVLKVQGTEGSLLLTGDIESLAESDLVRERPQALKADVVLLPHHGSDSSSTPPFVAAVGSSISLVSAGFSNRWGLPSPAVVERWSQQGSEVISTADTGAIQVMFPASGRPFISHRERLDRRRYWQRDLSPGANPGAEL